MPQQLPSVSELLTSTSIPNLLQKTKSINEKNNNDKSTNLNDTSPRRQNSTLSTTTTNIIFKSTSPHSSSIISRSHSNNSINENIMSAISQQRRLTDSSIYPNPNSNMNRSNSTDYFHHQPYQQNNHNNPLAGPVNMVTTPSHIIQNQQRNNTGYQYSNQKNNSTPPNLSPRSNYNNHQPNQSVIAQPAPPPAPPPHSNYPIYPNSQFYHYSNQQQFPPHPQQPNQYVYEIGNPHQIPPPPPPQPNLPPNYYVLNNSNTQNYPRIEYPPQSQPAPPLLYDENNALINKRRIIKRRTRTGCLTCRKRRIKCDERKPSCHNCERSKKVCLGYENLSNLQPRRRTRDTSLDLPQEDGEDEEEHKTSPNEMSPDTSPTSLPKIYANDNIDSSEITYDKQPSQKSQSNTSLPPISTCQNNNNNLNRLSVHSLLK